MAIIAFLCAHELHWRIFKWLTINHLKRVAKLNNLEGVVLIFIMGLDFDFKEAIFDKYGFWKSFKYAFDFDAQKLEKEIYSNRIEPGFRLPMNKQIVMDENGYILLDGKRNGKWLDDLRVDGQGFLRHLGTRTEYIFDNVSNTVLLMDVVTNVTKPVGTIERINHAWTLVQLKAH